MGRKRDTGSVLNEVSRSTLSRPCREFVQAPRFDFARSDYRGVLGRGGERWSVPDRWSKARRVRERSIYLIPSTTPTMSPTISAINTTPPATLPLGPVKKGPLAIRDSAKAGRAMHTSKAADLQSTRRSAFNRCISSERISMSLERGGDEGALNVPITRKTSANMTRARPR
jgi:hypothetical protein